MSTAQRPRRHIGRAIRVSAAGLVVLAAVVIAVRPSLLTSLTAAVISDSAESPAPVADGPAPSAVTAQVSTDEQRYFGVSVETGSRATQDVGQFTAAVGQAPTLQLMFQGFSDALDSVAMRQVIAEGRVPILTWEPYEWRTPHEDVYPLTAITAGRFDDYLRDEAAKIAALGSPLVMRFAHEMNGDWYPWGAAAGENTPADYVAAYRHVHDVVTAAGATNVVWMWSPNLTDAEPDLSLASLYPGDEYVDWVGLSGYIRQPTDTFASRFTDTLAELDLTAPTKPVFLAETAVAPSANRAAQIADLVTGVMQTPRVIGFVWFNIDKPSTADWSVDDDPADAAALGAALHAGAFGAVLGSATAN